MELDAISDAEKELKDKKKDLLARIKAVGLHVKEKKVQSDRQILAFVHKWSYYSRYVSEKGAMYDYTEGACEIDLMMSLPDFMSKILKLQTIPSGEILNHADEVVEIFQCLGEQGVFGEMFNIPSHEDIKRAEDPKGWGGGWWGQKDLTDFEIRLKKKEWLRNRWTKLLSMFSCDGLHITFRYAGNNGHGTDGEYVDDSGFNIGEYSESYIEAYKSIEVEDTFDDWKYGKIKW